MINPVQHPLLPEDDLMGLGICGEGFPDNPNLEGVGVGHLLAVDMDLENLDLGVRPLEELEADELVAVVRGKCSTNSVLLH